MNILLLGADHIVAVQLSKRLSKAGLYFTGIKLPRLDQPLQEELLSEISDCHADLVFFSPSMPVSRLSFRRRLHLVDVVKKLCAAVKKRDTTFIYLSTSQVYDGKLDRAYHEDDRTVPGTDLAKVWQRWESIVQRQFKKALILRPGWLLGGSQSMLSSEIKQAVGFHAAPDRLPQAKGNPIMPAELARVIMAILQQIETGARNYGIYHIAGKDVLSTSGVLKRISPESYLHVDEQSDLLNYELECQKIRDAFGIQQRAW